MLAGHLTEIRTQNSEIRSHLSTLMAFLSKYTIFWPSVVWWDCFAHRYDVGWHVYCLFPASYSTSDWSVIYGDRKSWLLQYWQNVQ